MNIVVLEDEAPARRLIVSLLRELAPTARIEAELESLEEARLHFRAHRPDLVISDIRLGDGSAFTLFEEGLVEAPVIFVTAYDAWYEQAFAFLSVSYLLKPIDREALAGALDKLARLRRTFGRVEAAEATALLRRPRARVLVRHRSETRAVPVDAIAYFRADDKLTLAVDRDGREMIVDRTLGQLESELDAATFFRAGRGHLVHVASIQSFRSGGRGRIELTLSPRTTEPVLVSQENAEAFRAFIDR